MRQPRLLTANAKAATGSAANYSRSGVEIVDRRGFVRLVGTMATAPQNEANGVDLEPRYEQFDVLRKVWVAADARIVRQLAKMPEDRRRAYLRGNAAVLRVAASFDTLDKNVDGDYYVVPGGYATDNEARAILSRAIKTGILGLGGRSYKIKLCYSSAPQHNDRSCGDGNGSIVYAVTRAGGVIKMTHEALLLSIRQRSL